jgi:hypothetical protein
MKAWVYGLLLSVVVGAIATWLFLDLLRHWLRIKRKKPPGSIPPWLTGAVERLFFTVLIGIVGLQPGFPAAMVGWLALKLATNWNYPDKQPRLQRRAYAFSALLAGLISMLFAALGGLICHGDLWTSL